MINDQKRGEGDEAVAAASRRSGEFWESEVEQIRLVQKSNFAESRAVER
jgi:hypothetical protein